MEELIKEAFERYPKGTVFISALPVPKPSIVTASGKNYYYEHQKEYGDIIWNGSAGGWLHCNGVWANIAGEESYPIF